MEKITEYSIWNRAFPPSHWKNCAKYASKLICGWKSMKETSLYCKTGTFKYRFAIFRGFVNPYKEFPTHFHLFLFPLNF